MGLFQVKDDVYLLHVFSEAVRAGFQDGVPPHIANPEKSVFAIMSESEYKEKSVEQIQDIFRQKHIIVTDMRTTPLQFDEEGLMTLTNLSTIADIQGAYHFFAEK